MSDEIRPGFHEALASASSWTVSPENPIPGLGGDEYVIPALWACDLRRRMSPEMRAENDELTRQFIADNFGPWRD